MPVVTVGDNLPSPVRIGLTDLTNIGPHGPPGSGTTDMDYIQEKSAHVSKKLIYDIQLIPVDFVHSSSVLCVSFRKIVPHVLCAFQ